MKVLIKKLSILLIIIACLFTISAVCAEDAGNSNNTNIGYESPTYTESSGECLKFIDLYNELLTEEDKEIQYIILTYVPERLSVKGYEIVNSEFFELEKY